VSHGCVEGSADRADCSRTEHRSAVSLRVECVASMCVVVCAGRVCFSFVLQTFKSQGKAPVVICVSVLQC
jgi:hypothetical protein